MSNTYYDSQLTAAEIEAALEAIDGVISPSNNGKVLAIEDGGIVAKDVSEYTDLPVLVSKNITANGDYDPASDNADGYDSVSVNVPNSYSAGDEGKVVSNGALVAQTARSSEITQNGTYDTTVNDEVTVNVSGGGSPTIEPLSVTQNGTYTAPSGVDGYSPVTVNVSGGGGIVECEMPNYESVTADSTFESSMSIGRVEAPRAMGSGVNCWWGAANNSSHYLLVTFDEAIEIIKIKFSHYWSDGTSTWYSSRVTVQGSNDGSTWTDLIDATNLPANNTQNEYTIQNPAEYLYYRFVCYSTTQYYTGVGRVQMYYEVSGGSGGDKNILIGTDEPSASTGRNGDIYLLYDDTEIPVLPTGTTPIEYIESTGTQYIDSGIPGNTSNLRVVSKIMMTGIASESSSSGDAIWASTWGTNGYLLIRFGSRPGVFRWHSGGKYVDVSADLDIWHDVETTKSALIIDGNQYALTSPSGSDTSNNVYLFYRSGGSFGYPGILRMCRTKFYSGDTLIADFVPCIDSNNEVCLYDLVSETFKRNAGSGSFLAGVELNPDSITQTYCKVNGSWVDLIGQDINDVNLGPTLISKSITANGTYKPADDNADGYSSVTVNVS